MHHLYVNWRTSSTCFLSFKPILRLSRWFVSSRYSLEAREGEDTLQYSRCNTQVRFGTSNQGKSHEAFHVCSNVGVRFFDSHYFDLSRPNQRNTTALIACNDSSNGVFTNLVPSPSKRQPKIPILCSRQSTFQLQERRRSREYQQSLGRGSHIHAKEWKRW